MILYKYILCMSSTNVQKTNNIKNNSFKIKSNYVYNYISPLTNNKNRNFITNTISKIIIYFNSNNDSIDDLNYFFEYIAYLNLKDYDVLFYIYGTIDEKNQALFDLLDKMANYIKLEPKIGNKEYRFIDIDD